MRITSVETFYLRLPVIEERCDGTQDTLVVRIGTDVGLTGVGEVDSSPLVAQACIEAPVSHTIAREKIFDPLRRACGGMSTWRGYVLSCPYCASHWLAFVLVPLTGTYLIRVVPQWGFASSALDWFLSSILVTVVAAFLRVGFYFVDEGQRLTREKKKATQAEVDDQDRPALQ